MTNKEKQTEARKLVVEWDEYGQGYNADNKLVVCICGEARPDANFSDHYCPYDEIDPAWADDGGV